MLTLTGEYAMRAMLHIAAQPPERYVLALEMGEQLAIPGMYLSKILGQLSRHGLLESRRGRKGGFKLARDPASVTVYDVLLAVEQSDRFERCLLGFDTCDDATPCLMHKNWKRVKVQILDLFKNTTLADLVNGNGQEGIKKLKIQTKVGVGPDE